MSFFNRVFKGQNQGGAASPADKEEWAEGTDPSIPHMLEQDPATLAADAQATEPTEEMEGKPSVLPPPAPAKKHAVAEDLIVDALLRQTEGMTFVLLRCVNEAGFRRFDQFLLSAPSEIATRADIPEDVAQAIVTRFQGYQAEYPNPRGGTNPLTDLKELSKIAKVLREQQALYETAASMWTRASLEEKRKLREVRSGLFLSARLCLARLGEMEFIEKLERMPAKTAIAEIIAFLQARAKARTEGSKRETNRHDTHA